MQKIYILVLSFSISVLTACQPPAAPVNTSNSNLNSANAPSNAINSANSNAANNAFSSGTVDAREPEKYQALVKLSLEALGETQNATLPALSAVVSRNGSDRRMEFALPTGEKIIYLDTAGSNYLILPNRKQYAELTKETLGFEVRRLLMPEQIVNQVKGVQGVERVGEEMLNGRRVVMYRYAASANTQTRAGQVATESHLLVDAETGLPLRSETVSQSQSGGNVQGYKGLRLVTEMSDLKMDPDPNSFTVPTEYAKVDPEQVKSQVSLIFNAVATLIGQAVQQQQYSSAPPASPMR